MTLVSGSYIGAAKKKKVRYKCPDPPLTHSLPTPNDHVHQKRSGHHGRGVKSTTDVSKETLETEITSLVDSVLALPIAQKNYLKFEIVCQLPCDCCLMFTGTGQIFQRELANQRIQDLGLPEAPPSVGDGRVRGVSSTISITSMFNVHDNSPKPILQRWPLFFLTDHVNASLIAS
jgi:hypothetical protein